MELFELEVTDEIGPNLGSELSLEGPDKDGNEAKEDAEVEEFDEEENDENCDTLGLAVGRCGGIEELELSPVFALVLDVFLVLIGEES